jgi:hypothetical protein
MNTEIFTLEYNEEQGVFHHNHGQHEESTNGWIAVVPRCTLQYSFFYEKVCIHVFGEPDYNSYVPKWKMTAKQAKEGASIARELYLMIKKNP